MYSSRNKENEEYNNEQIETEYREENETSNPTPNF